jgi:dienelactone hydrolase
MKWFLAAALCAFVAAAGHVEAQVHGKSVIYEQGDTELEGYLAFAPGPGSGKRPAVLIFHDWSGVGPYVKMRADQLAEAGYVAFAADIYGRGVRPETMEARARQASIYRADRALMRARARAGLDVLRGMDIVDRGRIAAIGYCFGGGVALELARSGAPLGGVVTFHGNLDTPDPSDARNIQGKVLVLAGAADPHVPPSQVAAFEEEMRAAGVNWQLNLYGGAVHSFTNPAAGDDPSRGSAYNAQADRRSWQAMQQFFAEIFQ